MKNYIKHDEWSIIEDGFRPEHNKISESIFSIGNGRMGQRANFEEKYSGETFQGSYVAGVYYPDKTRVGWWKNGYPEYFAKVLNAANWIGIDIEIEGEELDLNNCAVQDFKRTLNMCHGYLERSFMATTKNGKQVKICAQRFCSIVDDEVGAIKYSLTPLNFSGQIKFTPYIDADVKNEDSNYDEKFWEELAQNVSDDVSYVIAKTKKLDFHVCTGMAYEVEIDNQNLVIDGEKVSKEKYVGQRINVALNEGQELVLFKYAANISSENHTKNKLAEACEDILTKAKNKGFSQMLKEQSAAWEKKWEMSDITIEGDVAAQQGIRFNIFQLHQTYTGEDDRLNIGPKGFTGEKYGGSTYWDTEAYCIPFYQSTADPAVARNLLIYRYKHLKKAIENAALLGFDNGAALFPMVTMNGEECHNEWEITFEEIHRNGAIAYAIYDYVDYTGDEAYLSEYGLEVLIGISRFWAQRVNFSQDKQKYVMLGVTGPNEYENNVNNNWYTNTIAVWTLKYTIEILDKGSAEFPEALESILEKTQFQHAEEAEKWRHIIDNMYYPFDVKRDVFFTTRWLSGQRNCTSECVKTE